MTDRSSFVDTSSLELPVVPLRDMVVFPSMMAPFVVGRSASITRARGDARHLREEDLPGHPAGPEGRRSVDDGELYDIGVIATVVQNLKLPNRTSR